MRNRLLFLSLVATLFATTLLSQERPEGPSAPKKPEYASEVFAIFPSGYDQLIGKAGLVVRVRIIASEPKIVQNPNSYPIGWTVHTAQVLDTVKGHAGKTIRFEQRASRIETENYVVTTEGQEPLLLNHEYLVFLTPKDKGNGYFLTFERDSVFEMERGAVRPFGVSQVARDHAGMSEHRFMRELRDRVSRLEVQK